MYIILYIYINIQRVRPDLGYACVLMMGYDFSFRTYKENDCGFCISSFAGQ